MTDIAIKIEHLNYVYSPGLHTKNMHSKTFAWRFHTVNLWESSVIPDQENLR